jgi:hypothetical protein
VVNTREHIIRNLWTNTILRVEHFSTPRVFSSWLDKYNEKISQDSNLNENLKKENALINSRGKSMEISVIL